MDNTPLDNEEDSEIQPVRKDKSLWIMGSILAVIILIMGYLTLFSEDPWSFFTKEKTPIAVVDNSSLLDKNSNMSDDEVRSSLVKFIEAFYNDQRRGYFDPPSYFADITETFYNYHNLNQERLKEIYWKRLSDMHNFSRTWVVSSLDFIRADDKITATYWTREKYYRSSNRQQYSGDLKYEIRIDEEGKIESLNVIETKNESVLQLTPDTISTPPGEDFNLDINVEGTADTKVYDMGQVDVAPEFNGGQKEFTKYVSSNIKYPAQARQNEIQGKVYLSFIVEKDGSLNDIRVKQGIGGGCDEEALRILQSSANWKPGMLNNNPVRTFCVFPLTFQLTN
ncbi:energy transducer TonB [Arcticibacter eurypsychrophilus]|uniref:energy transducer TonB n=1 Tax=Arcticibacter eurypsychrophilus TaxID=1434752 RepID=UPI00084D3C7B|nr:energy transducer TonB [Arcticibacter eurypsychrophilus]